MLKIHRVGKKLSTLDLLKEYDMPMSVSDLKERLSGKHCSCEEGKELFVLLPKDCPSVIEGGKRYMVCLNCGEYSHL